MRSPPLFLAGVGLEVYLPQCSVENLAALPSVLKQLWTGLFPDDLETGASILQTKEKRKKGGVEFLSPHSDECSRKRHRGRTALSYGIQWRLSWWGQETQAGDSLQRISKARPEHWEAVQGEARNDYILLTTSIYSFAQVLFLLFEGGVSDCFFHSACFSPLQRNSVKQSISLNRVYVLLQLSCLKNNKITLNMTTCQLQRSAILIRSGFFLKG